MEAKDTVMKPEELDRLAEQYPCLDFSFEDDYQTECEIMRETQAEISFKAGKQEGVRELFEKVNQWADERIADYNNILAGYPENHEAILRAKVDMLFWAKQNLKRLSRKLKDRIRGEIK